MAARKRFEGREVAGVQLKVSAATVNLDGPEQFHVGDVVHVVVEATVHKVARIADEAARGIMRLREADDD